MVIAQFLSYLVRRGVILGFAKVDHTNAEELKAAIYLGLCVVTGADMQVAQQRGEIWDYVPGSPDWGGHCFDHDGYRTNYETVSWGSGTYLATPAFVSHQVSEVYLVITQGLVDHPGFRDHLSLDAFAAAFTTLTGRPWTYSPTPTPTPAPAPTPTPIPTPVPIPPTGGGASFQLSDPVAARVAKAAALRHVSGQDWLERHLRHYFKVAD